MNERLIDKVQIAQAFPPASLDGGAQAGDWHSFENHRRALILFHKGVGTAGDDPTITVTQATSAAGAGEKALNLKKLYKKEAVDLEGVAQFSEVTSFDTANAYGAADDATIAEKELIWGIEVDAADLDADNGFTFMQVSCDDPGTNAQLGGCLVIFYDPRYPVQPADAESVIA